VLDNGRIEVAAQATGIAGAALETAISYAKDRRVSGHPIADFQGLQWMLADSATDLAAARALAMQAAVKRGTGARYSSESAIAKLFASEAAWRIADRAAMATRAISPWSAIYATFGFSASMKDPQKFNAVSLRVAC
jgi:alkylation response protein AidB-like acyl-CoA dehydrogenase